MERFWRMLLCKIVLIHEHRPYWGKWSLQLFKCSGLFINKNIKKTRAVSLIYGSGVWLKQKSNLVEKYDTTVQVLSEENVWVGSWWRSLLKNLQICLTFYDLLSDWLSNLDATKYDIFCILTGIVTFFVFFQPLHIWTIETHILECCSYMSSAFNMIIQHDHSPASQSQTGSAWNQHLAV